MFCCHQHPQQRLELDQTIAPAIFSEPCVHLEFLGVGCFAGYLIFFHVS
jgi:hypothetical protein